MWLIKFLVELSEDFVQLGSGCTWFYRILALKLITGQSRRCVAGSAPGKSRGRSHGIHRQRRAPPSPQLVMGYRCPYKVLHKTRPQTKQPKTQNSWKDFENPPNPDASGRKTKHMRLRVLGLGFRDP